MGIVLGGALVGQAGCGIPPSVMDCGQATPMSYANQLNSSPTEEGISSILPRIYEKIIRLCTLGEVLRSSIDPNSKPGCPSPHETSNSGPIGVVQALYRLEGALEYLGDHLQFVHGRLNT